MNHEVKELIDSMCKTGNFVDASTLKTILLAMYEAIEELERTKARRDVRFK